MKEKTDNDASYHLNQGRLHFTNKEYSLALDDFNASLNLNSNSAEAFYFRGCVYSELTVYDKAICDYTIAISLYPNSANVFNARGISYKRIEAYEKAIEDYTTAINLKPNDAGFFYNRAFVYTKIKADEKAIEDYTTVISIEPNNADAFYSRGCVYSKKGSYDSAIDDFEIAIGMNPKYSCAYCEMGVIYTEKKLYAEAIKCFNIAMETKQNCAEIFVRLGDVFTYQGMSELAIKYFLRSLYLGLTEGDLIIKCLSFIYQKTYCPFLVTEYYSIPLRFTATGTSLKLSDEIVFQADKMQQFLIAISKQESSGKLILRTKAIINYLMGNPIEAFRIFDEKWEDDSTETLQDMFGQYYFYKSASLFFQGEEAILAYALEQMKKKIESNTAVAIDYYYAALLCIEQNNYELALRYLREAVKDKETELPALYALLSCFRKTNSTTDERETCKAICLMERELLKSSNSGYFVGFHISKISFEPDNYMSKLSHYCHYDETFESYEILLEYIEKSDEDSWDDLKAIMTNAKRTIGELWEFTDGLNVFLSNKKELEKNKCIDSLEKILKPDDPSKQIIKEEWSYLESSRLASIIGLSFDERINIDKNAFLYYRNIVLYYSCLGKLEVGDMMLLLLYFSIKNEAKYILLGKKLSIFIFAGIIGNLIKYLVELSPVNGGLFTIADILKPSIASLVSPLFTDFLSRKLPNTDFKNLSYDKFAENFFNYLDKAKKTDKVSFERIYKDVDKLFQRNDS